MANNELNYGGMEFDKGLDFNFEEPTHKALGDMSKREVASEVLGGGVKGVSESLTNSNKWLNAIRAELPAPFKETWNTYDQTTQTLGDLYDHAQKEVQPVLGQIAKGLDAMVPDSFERTKKVTSYLKEKFYEAPGSGRMTPEQIQNQATEAMLGEVFKGLQSSPEAPEEESSDKPSKKLAKETATQQIEKDRFDQSIQFLSRMDTSLNKLSLYQERVGMAVDRKGLELSFRKYALLADLVQRFSATEVRQTAQLNAVIKNTGLPETKKVHMSDRFGDTAKRRFTDSIHNHVFGSQTRVGGALEKVKADAKEVIEKFKSALQMGLMGVEGVKEAGDGVEAFGMSKPGALGDFLGGYLGDWGRDKIVKKVMPEFSNDEEFRKFGYKAGAAALNPLYGLAHVEESETYKTLKEGKFGTKVEGGMDWLKSLLQTQKGNTNLEGGSTFKGMLDPEDYTKRVNIVHTEVVPGYLARILREVTMFRTGDDTALLTFDPMTGHFKDAPSIKDGISKLMDKEFANNAGVRNIKDMSTTLAENMGLDEPEANEALIKLIMSLMHSNHKLDGKTIQSSTAYENASEPHKAIYDKMAEKLKHDTLEKDKSIFDYEYAINDMRKNLESGGSLVQNMIDGGLREQLIEMGVVTRMDDGSLKLSEKAMSDRIEKAALADSDVNLKHNFKPINNKKALKGIKNLPMAAWEYKDNKRGKGQKIGPMAQDLNKELGEEVAPGGKKVDLVSANGVTMAAIQEIAKNQDELKEEVQADKRQSVGVKSRERMKNHNGSSWKQREKMASSPVTSPEVPVDTPDKSGSWKLNDYLSAINQSIIEMHNTLKTKNFMLGIPGMDFSKFKMPDVDLEAVKDKAKKMVDPLIETGNQYFDTLQSLIQTAVKDGGETLIKGYRSFKDKIFTPGKDKIKSLWEENKDGLKTKVKSYANSTLDFGKDVLFKHIPEGVKSTINGLKNIKETAKRLVNGPVDVYLKGSETPVLLASRMRAGTYAAVKDGKIIRGIDDLLAAGCDIIDIAKNNEVALRWSDAADGLFNQHGVTLKTTGGLLTGLALGGAAWLGKKALGAGKAIKDFANSPSMFPGIMESLRGMKDSIMEKFSGMFGFGFHDVRQLAILAQIRDLLAIGKKRNLLNHVYNRDLKDEKLLAGKSFLALLFGNKIGGKLKEGIDGLLPAPIVLGDNTDDSNKTKTNGKASEDTLNQQNFKKLKDYISEKKWFQDAKAKISSHFEGAIDADGNPVKKGWRDRLKGYREKLTPKAEGDGFWNKTKNAFSRAKGAFKNRKKKGPGQTNNLLQNEDENNTGFSEAQPTPGTDFKSKFKDYTQQARSVFGDKENKNTFGQKLKQTWQKYNPFKPAGDPNVLDAEEGYVSTSSPLANKKKNVEDVEDKLSRRSFDAKKTADKKKPWSERIKSKISEISGKAKAAWAAKKQAYREADGSHPNEPPEAPWQRPEATSEPKPTSRKAREVVKEYLGKAKAAWAAKKQAYREADGSHPNEPPEAPWQRPEATSEPKPRNSYHKNRRSPLPAKKRNVEDVEARVPGTKPKGLKPHDVEESKSLKKVLLDILASRDKLVNPFKQPIDSTEPQPLKETWASKAKRVMNKVTRRAVTQTGEEEASPPDGREVSTVPARAQGTGVVTGGASSGHRGLSTGRGGRFGSMARWAGDKALAGARGIGAIGSAVGGVFGALMGGETPMKVDESQEGTALSKVQDRASTVRGMNDGTRGKSTFSDIDGDGNRDGGSTEQLRRAEIDDKARKEREASKAAEAAKSAQAVSLRYKSSENQIDALVKGATGLIGMLTSGASGLFDLGKTILSKIPGIGSLISGAGRFLLGGAKMVGRAAMWGGGKLLGAGASLVGATKAAYAAGGLAGVAKAGAGALRAGGAVGRVLTTARIAAMATGTMGGTVVAAGIGVLQAGLALALSPVGLGVIGAAIVGYGLYKGYKYFTRNSLDDFEKVRAVQYGLNKDSKDLHKVMELEGYFLNGRLTYTNGVANFNPQKVKAEEIMEIMDIKPDDAARADLLNSWLSDRFKPFFLNHVSALFIADPKLKLTDVEKLKFEQTKVYLDKAQYLDGPYDKSASPFESQDSLPNTKEDVEKMVAMLLKEKEKKKDRGTFTSNVLKFGLVGALLTKLPFVGGAIEDTFNAAGNLGKKVFGFGAKIANRVADKLLVGPKKVLGAIKTIATFGEIGKEKSFFGKMLSVILPIPAAMFVVKGVKYLARNNLNDFEKFRAIQYGLTHKSDDLFRVIQLEDYFLDGRIAYTRGVASINSQKVKPAEVLEILGVSETDKKRVAELTAWLIGRFQPFFLNHLTALFEASPKTKLQDIEKLEFGALNKYLDKAQFLDGPYAVSESPFTTQEAMLNTKEEIPKLIEVLRLTKKKKARVTNTGSLKDDVAANLPALKNLQDKKKEQAEQAKKLTEDQKKAVAPKKPEPTPKEIDPKARTDGTFASKEGQATAAALNKPKVKPFVGPLPEMVGPQLPVDVKQPPVKESVGPKLPDVTSKEKAVSEFGPTKKQPSVEIVGPPKPFKTAKEIYEAKNGTIEVEPPTPEIGGPGKKPLRKEMTGPPKPFMTAKEKHLARVMPETLKGDDGGIQPPEIKNDATTGIKQEPGTSVPLVKAGGPLTPAKEGMASIALHKNTRIDGLNPRMRDNLLGMAGEYQKATNKRLLLTDGLRTYAEQKALHDRMPDKAAKPGSSMHEFGLAVDINTPDANQLEKMGLMRKYGFTRPIGGELWHTEPAGIQENPNKAKQDPNWAVQQIDASPGRGGGGYGMVSGSKMKARNPATAKAAWNSVTDTVVDNKPKDEETQATGSLTSPITSRVAKADNKSSSDLSVSETTPKKQGLSSGMAPSPVDKNPVGINGSKGLSDANPSFTGLGPDPEGEPAPSGISPTGKTAETTKGETAGYSSKSITGLSDKDESSISKASGKGTGLDETKEVIKKAALRAKMDPPTLQLFAAAESAMGQNQNGGGKAQGPFQFMPGTWKQTLGRYGKKYDLSPQTPPTDLEGSALMTSEYLNENKKLIQKHKSPADFVDYYLSHMLGPGGIQTFLKIPAEGVAAEKLPDAARENHNVFFRDGKKMQQPMTAGEVRQNLVKRFNKLSTDYGISMQLDPGKLGPAANDKSASGVSTPGKESTKVEATVASSDISRGAPGSKEAAMEKKRNETSRSEVFTPGRTETMSTAPPSLVEEKQPDAKITERRKPTESLRGNADMASGMVSILERGLEVDEKLLKAVQNDMVPVLRRMQETLEKIYSEGKGNLSGGAESAKPVDPQKPNRTESYRSTNNMSSTPSILDRNRKYG